MEKIFYYKIIYINNLTCCFIQRLGFNYFFWSNEAFVFTSKYI